MLQPEHWDSAGHMHASQRLFWAEARDANASVFIKMSPDRRSFTVVQIRPRFPREISMPQLSRYANAESDTGGTSAAAMRECDCCASAQLRGECKLLIGGSASIRHRCLRRNGSTWRHRGGVAPFCVW